jgi:hypothetical protein
MNGNIQDKVDYVYTEFFATTKRYRVVTKGAVEAVLTHPPKSLSKVTSTELTRINRPLIVPLAPDAILEIQKLSLEYDKLFVDVVAQKKHVQHVEDAYALPSQAA